MYIYVPTFLYGTKLIQFRTTTMEQTNIHRGLHPKGGLNIHLNNKYKSNFFQ